MKIIFILISVLTASIGLAKPLPETLGSGKQPQVGVDPKGVIRVVFGEDDKIFCSTSTNSGDSFSKPVLVAEVPGMHLGMSRGPQIASSDRYSIITAIDKTGNIHSFKLSHQLNKWEHLGLVNDMKGSAPEGLMSVAADTHDNFYATWLDTRQNKQNEVCFASLQGTSTAWSKNKLIYTSPSGHVCECCRPSVVTAGTKVAVMFRNWLWGSRDLYYVASRDRGKSFSKGEKLGEGTWKLDACPMDGGGIAVDGEGKVHSAWQRQGEVYYCTAGEKEKKIGTGRTVSLVQTESKPVILYQANGGVRMVSTGSDKEVTIGEGGFAKGAALANGKLLLVWEKNKQVMFSVL